MAGGPSTVELVAAATAAGALGFLAGGYKTAAQMADEIEAVRAAGVSTFGLNVFVPGRPAAHPGRVSAYVASLAPEAAALGADPGEPTWDGDDYERKLEVLLARPPAVVSFTFGLPDVEVVRSLQSRGSMVALTVTTPEEAARALRTGPDALCLQGAEAGAHRGSLANDDRPDQDRPIDSLLAAVCRRTTVPLIAAGGVGGPGDVAALLARGAALVQAGTAFLRCPESGAPQPHKDALADSRVRRDHRHPRLQREAGPSARQRHGARSPRRAGGLPGGQQRHPAAAGRGGAGRRCRAHEPLRRHGVPPCRGPARRGGGRAVGVRIAPVSSRRETMTIEFTPPDVAGVADALAKLRHAGDGWVNLLPGIDEDTVDMEPPSGLFAFFGNRAPPVSMATVLPAKPDRRDREGMTVGLMHPTGAKAVARLAEAGITLPDGWVLRQDHVRRGLVARTPVGCRRGRGRRVVRPGRHGAVPGRDDGALARRRLPSVGGHGGSARRRRTAGGPGPLGRGASRARARRPR